MVRRFVPVGNAATVAQVLAEIPPERLTLVTELFGAAVRASAPAFRRCPWSRRRTTSTGPSSECAEGSASSTRFARRWPICIGRSWPSPSASSNA